MWFTHSLVAFFVASLSIKTTEGLHPVLTPHFLTQRVPCFRTTKLTTARFMSMDDYYFDAYTSAVTAVCAFVERNEYGRMRGSYDELKKALEERSITTLQELESQIECVRWFLEGDGEAKLRQGIADGLTRTTPALALGGRYIPYYGCPNEWEMRMYSPDAVSVYPEKIEGPVPDFSIVMGPCGSGKTIFAAKRLHELVFAGVDRSKILVLLFKPSPIMRTMKLSKVDFPTAVAQYVQEFLDYEGLSRFGKPLSIQLYFHVIINMQADTPEWDSAFREAIATTENLQNAAKALQSMKTYNFAKGTHLTVAGNGLDLTTMYVDSAQTVKFRMQPWKPNHFKALMEALNR